MSYYGKFDIVSDSESTFSGLPNNTKLIIEKTHDQKIMVQFLWVGKSIRGNEYIDIFGPPGTNILQYLVPGTNILKYSFLADIIYGDQIFRDTGSVKSLPIITSK